MEKNNALNSFHVVLFQPEIPANTGNIGRLCVGMNATLHLIKPMRFLLTDKHVKRAGLDYWDKLDLEIYNNLDEFLTKFSKHNIYYCTTKSKNNYAKREYRKGDVFIFGPESRGIPESILNSNKDNNLNIPMTQSIRSINLSNSVAIILYEAWRQVGFGISKQVL